MQHDEVIWQVIRHNHCSFMAKIETGIFCRNEYNVTGICNRSSCPLANSRYATIRNDDGVFYLYMKSIERSHMPNKMWERVKLSRNYEKALEVIDKHLMYWPKFLVHKTKQRLTKMTQMRIRMRKLGLKTREKIIPVPRKESKRELRRESKAEKAARLDKAIEKELLDRLREGVYKGIHEDILDKHEQVEVDSEEEEEHGIEYVEAFEEEEEDDMEDFLAIEENGSEDEGEDDEETVAIHRKRERRLSEKKLDASSTKSKKKPRVHVEVEHDEAGGRQTSVQ